jgi:hypothetical protein
MKSSATSFIGALNASTSMLLLTYYAAKFGTRLDRSAYFNWGLEGQLHLWDPKHTTQVDPLVISLKEI